MIMVDMEFEEGEIREIMPGMRQSKGCIRRIFIGKNSIPSEAICTAGMNIPLMTRVEALNGQLVRGEIVGVPKFTLNQISTDAMELIVNLVKPGEITNFEYIEYLGSDQGKNDIKYQLEALKLLGKIVLTNINQFTGEQLDNRFIDRSLVRQIINKVKYGSEGKRLPKSYMKISQKDIDKVYELLVINVCAPYKFTLKYNDVKKDALKLFYKIVGRNVFDYFNKPKDINFKFS